MCTKRRLRSAWASALSDQSSLSAWRKLGSLATHWAQSEYFDQTGQMSRLIWVFAGRTVILLVLSWGGSFCSNFRILLLGVQNFQFFKVVYLRKLFLISLVSYQANKPHSNTILQSGWLRCQNICKQRLCYIIRVSENHFPLSCILF